MACRHADPSDRGRPHAGELHRAELRADSYAVTIAHDRQAGEIATLTGDYALVLLDLTLPGKSGLDVLETIRGCPEACGTLM